MSNQTQDEWDQHYRDLKATGQCLPAKDKQARGWGYCGWRDVADVFLAVSGRMARDIARLEKELSALQKERQ